IHTVLPGGFRSFAELDVFGEANAVGCGEYAIETDLLGVFNGFQIIRRERRLTAGEENDDLPSRLKRNRPSQNRFGVFKRRLGNVANLVRIHEARIAHHVATIRQVNGQHRAAAKLDIRSSVTMNVLIFSGAKVTTKE